MFSLKIKEKSRNPAHFNPYGGNGVRRMSFPHNGVIFKPDLPPIDEEELSDSSMDTEDEDIDDSYVIEAFSNDIQRDIEVSIIHFMLWYIFQRLLKNTPASNVIF